VNRGLARIVPICYCMEVVRDHQCLSLLLLIFLHGIWYGLPTVTQFLLLFVERFCLLLAIRSLDSIFASTVTIPDSFQQQIMSIYTDNGYSSREDYLNELREDYGDLVDIALTVLPPSEDFDGLITTLQDMQDLME